MRSFLLNWVVLIIFYALVLAFDPALYVRIILAVILIIVLFINCLRQIAENSGRCMWILCPAERRLVIERQERERTEERERQRRMEDLQERIKQRQRQKDELQQEQDNHVVIDITDAIVVIED